MARIVPLNTSLVSGHTQLEFALNEPENHFVSTHTVIFFGKELHVFGWKRGMSMNTSTPASNIAADERHIPASLSIACGRAGCDREIFAMRVVLENYVPKRNPP